MLVTFADCYCVFRMLQLYSVDVATGNDIQRLTVSVGNRTGGMGGKPSPCGKFLAFASDRGASMPQGLFDLYVVRLGLDGLPAGQPRRLTRGAADQFSRSWSPDSKYLAFNSQVRAMPSEHAFCLVSIQFSVVLGHRISSPPVLAWLVQAPGLQQPGESRAVVAVAVCCLLYKQ